MNHCGDQDDGVSKAGDLSIVSRKLPSPFFKSDVSELIVKRSLRISR